MTTLIKET